jgi:hypothetical protein
LARVHQSTQSLQVATASLQQFTASQDDRNFVVSQVTGSLIGITNGLMAFTAALDNTYATDAQLYQLYQATRSIELTTGSLIGITNGLMAFTAALDSTYATDAQLYQLYQSTRSLELHSGSMIGVTNGLMAYTASNETWKDGVRGEISGIEAYTASLKGQAIVSSSTQVQNYDVFALNSNLYTSTGSLIGITNGLMAFTAALDSTYATDAQLLPILQATRSLELLSGSLIGITNGLMAFTAALDSTYATDAQLYQLYAETASIKAEIGGIEAYTASLKGAAIVSSSQQITNYYKFAETASANTFYGNQTFASSGGSGLRVYGGAGTHQWDMYLNGQNIRLSDNTAGDGAVRIDQRLDVGGHVTASGNLYIGAALQVQSDSAAITLKQTSTTAATGIYLERSGEQKGYYMYLGGSADSLTFQRNNAGTKADVMALSRDGDVTVSTGNLVMGTAGKGIDFSATSNGSGTTTSELLNDYEEGTFTPTYTGTDLTVVSYGNQFGWYTKVGRLVTVTICLMTEDITVVGSQNLKIGGLPFTSNSTAQATNALVIGDSSRWSTNPPKYGVIQPNVTEIVLYRDSGATGAGTDPVNVKTDDLADVTGNRNVMRATLTYFV